MNRRLSGHLPIHIIVVIILVCFGTLVCAAPEIRFSFGRVQGVDLLAQNTSKPFFAYYGIPFAQPPIGALRFRPPEPFTNNDPNRVISATGYRPACIQSPGLVKDMSEDCLHLNVFTPPSASSDQKKKVMVYIHGGAFVIGDAREARSSRLVTDYDVIVVAIQYRLGVMGFISTMDKVVPGNNGIRDQILALQWVKDNVARFGGDADDVTIFGESAGAGSISILSVTPLAKGLFTKGIMQSGTLLAPWGNIRKSLQLTYAKAKSLRCVPMLPFPSKESYHETMMNCIRSKPVAEINTPPSFVRSEDAQLDLDLTHYIDFGPVVDGEIIAKEPFGLMLDKDHLEKSGTFNRSYLIGLNNNEGISIVDSFVTQVPGATLRNLTDPQSLATYIRTSAKIFLPYQVTSEMLDVISFVYTYPRLANGDIPLQGVLDVTADTNFAVPSVLFARGILKASPKTDIYLYLLDHYPKLKDPSQPLRGSNHGMDLIYTFDNQPMWESLAFYAEIYTEVDAPMFDVFRRMLTSFAKTRNSPRAGLNAPMWPRYDLDTQYYMSLKAVPEVRRELYAMRVALWSEFLPKLLRDAFSPGPLGFTV